MNSLGNIMYELDKNEYLDFILGKKLEQVSIGLHQIILNFMDDLSISIEDKFEVKFPGLEPIVSSKEEYPSVGAKLVDFLGEKIEKVVNSGDGRLHITFSNEKVLVIHHTSHNYESFQITDPDHQIIV